MTKFATHTLEDLFLNTSLSLSTGELLTFFACKASGEAFITKAGAKPIVDLSALIDFTVSASIDGGSSKLEVTGRVIVKELTGPDEMSIKIQTDDKKVTMGGTEGLKRLAKEIAERMQSEGTIKVRELISVDYFNRLNDC